MVAGKHPAARIQGLRESRAIVATLGGVVRMERRRRHLSQAELGQRVGVCASHISRIERGLGVRIPFEVWVALGLVLGRPLAVAFSRALEIGEPADAGHLQLQELAISLARRHGWHTSFELPTRPADPSCSVDVVARDDSGRRMHLWECWNRFGDLGAAARSTTRKVVEAEALAATAGLPGDGGAPFMVCSCWLVRPTAANRALLRRYPGILRSRFPGSSLLWARAIESGCAPPAEPGIVWCDPAAGRIVPVRWRD